MLTNPFLKSLAITLLEKYGRDIQDICIVFPNRRPGLFFRRYLSETAGLSLLCPQIYTISELMIEFSGLQQADPVDLVFKVYGVYRGLVEKPETFDEFYHWGEMMLRDFDDLDKYMVNAEALFKNIRDMKDIDTVFDFLIHEQKEIIRKFWGHFSEGKPSGYKESFIKFWELLYPVYSGLNKNLKNNSLAYEGMIYRDVAEKIIRNEYPEIPWKKIIISGFNALNKCEKVLFRHLRKSGIGEFYWDYDKYYTENADNEAGRFLRENLKEFPPTELAESFSNLGSQKICIYELPSDVTQAKFIYKLLENRDSNEIIHFHDTALVLCNEDLLIPVLTSLPLNISEVNITMGFPLSNTPVYSFIEQILIMQKKLAKQTGRRENRFYYKDVLAILNHQYIRIILRDELTTYIREIHEKNRIYLDKSWFNGKGLLEKIFIKAENIYHLIDYLIFILLEAVKTLSVSEPETAGKLEKEYIFYILTSLRKLREIFKEYTTETNIETFLSLFRKMLNSVRIPFEGEPLGGLQIMGILETRLLDFKNLIFLSMNEGMIPKTHTFFSYVPNNLRYAFNMLTREDHDAMYAYYFYRLMQRSQKVDLLYNSKTEGVGTGEKSRYLFQMLYGNVFKVDFKSIGFSIAERNPEIITIKKSPGIIKILEKFSSEGSHYLSPSSLSTYLDCRLKFYFSRIADLKEADEVGEEIEARDMGTILHETMFRLYSPLIGLIVNRNEIEKILHPASIKMAVDGAFRKVYYKTDNQSVEVIPEGKNIIIYAVIKRFVKKILQNDIKRTPFEIVDLEKSYDAEIDINSSSGIKRIRIGGKIDRIDRKNNRIRIVDYKTGNAETVIRNLNELFDRSLTQRNKAIFQTLVYGWIYQKMLNTSGIINTELYITRRIFNENFDPLVKINNEEIDFLKIREIFSEKLKEIISEIFDMNAPFDQTNQEENCKYCDFKEICHREAYSSYS